MIAYFQSIWKFRHFWWSLVKLDLRTRYRRSMLGIGWSLLHPVCMTVILCVVFHKLFRLDLVDYAPHVFSGLAVWQYILTCTLQGCHAFFQAEHYIRQTSMPLAIFPLRTVLGATFHLLIALSLVVAMLAVLAVGGWRPWHPMGVLFAVPGLGLLFVFCWSLAVIAGTFTVFFHDVHHLAEVGFQMLFYASPIMYQSSLLAEHGLNWLLQVNPIVCVLRLIREPLLTSTLPSGAAFFHALVLVTVLGACASVLLARIQKRLIFHL
jgi:ABC-type polysaccharide/polyol phosphate export permease